MTRAGNNGAKLEAMERWGRASRSPQGDFGAPLRSPKTRANTWAFLLVATMTYSAFAQPYAIPPESVDEQKVYWGNPASFSKPASVDFRAIVMATEEFKNIRREKVQAGTGRYWILISQASDRAVRAISAVGKEEGFDLVVAKGYLESVKIEVNAPDITELVLKKLGSQ